MKVHHDITADWQKVGRSNAVTSALGLDRVLVGKTQTTYVRTWDEVGNEKSIEEGEASTSLYAAAVTIGKHHDTPYFDRENTLVVPNVKIRCERLHGDLAPGHPPPFSVPAKFFVPGAVSGRQIELSGFWSTKNKVLLIGGAAFVNAARFGLTTGLAAGTLTFAALLAAPVFVPLAMTWGQTGWLALQWGGRVSGLGSLLGAGIGGGFQWRISDMERERAEILESMVTFDVGIRKQKNAIELDGNFNDIYGKKKSFEKRYGLEEAMPLVAAYAELAPAEVPDGQGGDHA